MPINEHIPADVRVIAPDRPTRYAFSICSLMTRPEQYERMLQSYRDAGFGADCEFLCVDNSQGNVHDAFSGYNAFLNEARGKYVILTHQDVELCFDNRMILEERLRELAALDPIWAACGNSGGVTVRQNAIRITDPHGEDMRVGTFPQQVFSLDENFIVVRREANLALSRDMTGYHMYGADLCVMADVLGWHCYVIDFHLRHLSGGTLDASFRQSATAFASKYARSFRSRWIPTPVTAVFVAGTRVSRFIVTSRMGRLFRLATKRR